MNLFAEGLELHLRPIGKADNDEWAKVDINAQAPGFTVQYTAVLHLPNLESFVSRLRDMQDSVGNECEAAFEGWDDPDFSIELRMDRRGHITGQYRFVSIRRYGEPTALSGSFDMDQSFLPSMIADISTLISDLRSS